MSRDETQDPLQLSLYFFFLRVGQMLFNRKNLQCTSVEFDVGINGTPQLPPMLRLLLAV
jgi:hypothetical protein